MTVICNRADCKYHSASNFCMLETVILNHGLCGQWFDKNGGMYVQPLYVQRPEDAEILADRPPVTEPEEAMEQQPPQEEKSGGDNKNCDQNEKK